MRRAPGTPDPRPLELFPAREPPGYTAASGPA